jgi:hypothetical protein
MSASLIQNSLFSALDSHTPKQLGENGHVEHGWSNDESELINQLYFQLVRAKTQAETKDIREKLETLIMRFKPSVATQQANTTMDISSSQYDGLSLLYKLIGHTRDVESKGERQLAYAQLWVWHKHYPELAKFAFKTFVYYVGEDGRPESNKHQYGSWNDVKYMCGAFKELGGGTEDAETHPMIYYAIKLMVDQLVSDKSKAKDSPISLAARHAPREGSRFGWVFNKMADMMFPYASTARTVDACESAKRKARQHLRSKVLAPLNKQLDTVQIKMAAGPKGEGEWDKIDFNTVTSKTMRQHSKAWQNLTKTDETRSSEEHRVVCADNYRGHIEKALSGDKTAKVHGKRCNTYELVRDAVSAGGNHTEHNKTETDRINLQWKSNSEQNAGMGNMVAIADVSGSMTCDESIPLYNAIGLSIRVSEKASPAFRDRIISFSETPTWVKLDGDKTFCEKVKVVGMAPWGMTTNLHAVFQMILDGIREADMPPVDVENMALVVFSDMQINSGGSFGDTIMETVIKMFHDAGMASKYAAPYPTPHLVWWNLRKTTGFPTLSTMKNTTMLSGYNAALLNAFEGKGVEALKEYTPARMIHDILSTERYKMLDRHILSYFS